MKEISMKRFIGAILVLLWANPALAVEGKTLINQARALAGGVTSGDTAGFPITISQPGSYLFVGSLIAPNDNVNIIEITTSGGVIIDMNNFFIFGGGTCTVHLTEFYATSCTNTGTGNGIYSVQSNIAIYNGAILGMGTLGINIDPATGSGYNIGKVAVGFCGGGGIALALSANLIDLVVGFNTGTGISVNRGGRLYRVTSGGNLGNGMTHAGGGTIADSWANDNSVDGIDIEDNSTVRGTRTVSNGAVGISVGYASLVLENQSNYNGTYGLVFGALAGTTVGYGNNVLIGNTTANTSGSGTQMGSNVCGTGLCP
jgi:hypothetical protein